MAANGIAGAYNDCHDMTRWTRLVGALLYLGTILLLCTGNSSRMDDQEGAEHG